MKLSGSQIHARQRQRVRVYAFHVAMVIAMATALAFALGCGAGESAVYYDDSGRPGSPGAPAALAAKDESAGFEREVVVEREVMVEKEVVREVEAEAMMGSDDFAEESAPAAKAMAQNELGESVDVSTQPQQRIIVRNADMVIESDQPVVTVDAIGDLAVSRGGWVVNSNTSDHGFYHITIRIPAETLDAVIEQISGAVTKVVSVNSDSTDFTEEYIDLGARRTTVQETVDALTQLLRNENYDNVKELLEVQREITNWQSELEQIDGRLSFIRESAAFSRLTVTVNRSPIPMQVDVGEDVHVGIGVGRKFTARFFPPEDYDRYEITWDFGDGSGTQTVYSGLRTQGEDGLLSVPVRHTYQSDEFSPHVVTVSIRAYSDRGLAEGEDQLWANVSELPRIDAFVTASEWDVEQGQPVTLIASFNHPDTLRNVRYTWDFRDGTPVVEGTVPSGDTGVEIEHAFDRYRPESYQVVFEIRGDSDAGEVEETHSVYIFVYPAPEIEGSDFDAGDTATSAVNVLIAVAAFAGSAGIWIAITSPIWLILGAGVFFLIRFIKRRQRNVQRVVFVPNPETEAEGEAAEEENTGS